MEKQLEPYNQKDRRRAFLDNANNITLMVRPAFNGSDLQALFEIESENISAVTPREKSRANLAAAVETPSGLKLLPRQLEGVRQLASPYGVGARILGIKPGSFSSLIKTAVKNNGLPMEEFLERAMLDELVDTGPLEQTSKPDLDQNEQLLLELVLYARRNGEEMELDQDMQASLRSALKKLRVQPNQPALTYVTGKHYGYI